MLQELILPDLLSAMRTGDWASVDEYSRAVHVGAVAEALERLDDDRQRLDAFPHIPVELRPQVFTYLPDDRQDSLAVDMPRQDLARLLERMSHDDRADLVQRMDEDRQAVIMPLVARAEREDILRLAAHEEDTAGSIMTTDYAALPPDLPVWEALHKLRQSAPDRETIYYIYVIDDARRLVGFVSLKDLIVAPAGKRVGDIMDATVMSVGVGDDVEDVARKVRDYDLIAIPVLDDEHRLVGIITHDDVTDVLTEEATEDAQMMGAVQPLAGSYVDSPFWGTVRRRVVWLWILFAAEMLAFFVLQGYETLFVRFAILVAFMPVITATGGNSGSQAAALITRALALNEVSPADWWKVGVRELLSGLALGALVGVVALLVTQFFTPGDAVRFPIVLMIALVAVTTGGSLIGSLLPLLFQRLGMDPAISSGPFVASLVDVFGISIYCTIATLLLM